ncbi:MAG TPA: polysaccharide biosynthesis/export family protein [Coleofasciculaceae cyanobacterium]
MGHTKLQELSSACNPTLTMSFEKALQPVLGLTIAALATVTCIAPSSAQDSVSQTSTTPGATQIPVTPPTPVSPAAQSEETRPTLEEGGASATPVPAPGLAPSTVPNRTLIAPSPTSTASGEDTYLLGAGDQIGLDIFDVPELSGANGRYTILVDGSINLPWVGRISLQGLSLEQASSKVTTAYAPYIRNPLITVNLLTARTLRISVVGEVKRPGSYIISPAGTTNQILVGDAAVAGAGAASQWPTVTQAIQSAGGITQLANLRQIQIRRPIPNGSEQLIDLNLWELLRTGRISQDITLRDRDTLIIPKAETISSDEALLIGSASFAPATIRVSVVGEVAEPGIVEVSPNTSLNQALLSAGGFDKRRARTSRVDLIRLNTDGTAVRRTVPIDLASGINEENNPSLRDGDTIIVGRSGITGVRDFLDDVFGPLDGVVGRIFDIFNVGD